MCISDIDFYCLDRYTLAVNFKVDPARISVNSNSVRARDIRGEGNGVEDTSLQGCEGFVGFDYSPFNRISTGCAIEKLQEPFLSLRAL